MAVRRDVFERLGGFCAPMFMYGEDMDFGHRLRLCGTPFGIVPAARIRHDHLVDKGAMKWRLMERNRHLVVLRTYPLALLVLLGPALLVCEVAIFGAAMRPDQNAMAVRDRMLELGVVTRAIGTETVTFCPPFVTTDAQVDRIVDAVATALR